MTLFYVDFLFSLEIIKLALRDHDQQGTIEGACICRISIWASLGHKHMKDTCTVSTVSAWGFKAWVNLVQVQSMMVDPGSMSVNVYRQGKSVSCSKPTAIVSIQGQSGWGNCQKIKKRNCSTTTGFEPARPKPIDIQSWWFKSISLTTRTRCLFLITYWLTEKTICTLSTPVGQKLYQCS